MTHNNKKIKTEDHRFETNAIHAGQEPEQWKSLCVVPPISLGTTFKQSAPGVHVGYEYGRSGNPTRNSLEVCLAALEGAKHALCFSSGSAALATLSFLLKQGDHIVSIDDVYGGTNRYFRQCANRMGIEITFVDMLDVEATARAFKSNTKMVWIETPTNPTLKLVDIKAVSDLARSHAKQRDSKTEKKEDNDMIVVVDNTFASSFFQQPLKFGADIVMHSLTKYMNGHSDCVMGACMLSDEKLYKRVLFLQNSIGAVPSPFDCFLTNRGLKTLPLRMGRHMENGLKVAKALSANSRIEKVIYPGLDTHPQHELYKTQMGGFGGMVSVYIKGGLEKTSSFLKALKIFTLAESLGGYESLIEHPALMTHAAVPKDQRGELGIMDNLVRISVGIEHIDDLIKDLEDALLWAIP